MQQPRLVGTPLTLIISLILAANANAASIAAETSVSTISPCPSFCGGGGGISEFDSDGGEGFTTSFSSIQTGINGTGQAIAQLNGGGISSLPNLGAEAFSEPNARVQANAAGMQRYMYTGPTSLFTLDVTLDGSVIDGSQPPDAALFANVIVILGPELDFFSDYGTFRFEAIPGTPGATILTETEIDYFALGLFDMGPQSVTNSISFTLNAGDKVSVWASLVARGTRGGSADAFNTLGMSFSGGNVANLVTVPLPAPILLLASCAGVLALRRRTLNTFC